MTVPRVLKEQAAQSDGMAACRKEREKKKKYNEMINVLRVDFDPCLVQANLVCARVSAHCYQDLENEEMD